MVQRPVETVHGVFAVVIGIVEEAVVNFFLATGLSVLHAVRQDHVVETLVGSADHLGVFPHDIQVFRERADPILTSELFAVLALRHKGDDFPSVAHLISPCERLRSRRFATKRITQ